MRRLRQHATIGGGCDERIPTRSGRSRSHGRRAPLMCIRCRLGPAPGERTGSRLRCRGYPQVHHGDAGHHSELKRASIPRRCRPTSSRDRVMRFSDRQQGITSWMPAKRELTMRQLRRAERARDRAHVGRGAQHDLNAHVMRRLGDQPADLRPSGRRCRALPPGGMASRPPRLQFRNQKRRH
jgi:hypothetical protein